MDYGKFRYLQKKKVQESKKHSTQVLVKEVKLGSRTSEHDIDFKAVHVRRFLEKKQRVKVSVLFRGREITHPELGKDMLGKFFEKVQDIGELEGQAQFRCTMFARGTYLRQRSEQRNFRKMRTPSV